MDKVAYEKETALIKKLEGMKCPPLIPRTKENWAPDNSAYWEFVTALKDAHWRCMMAERTAEEVAAGVCAPQG